MFRYMVESYCYSVVEVRYHYILIKMWKWVSHDVALFINVLNFFEKSDSLKCLCSKLKTSVLEIYICHNWCFEHPSPNCWCHMGDLFQQWICFCKCHTQVLLISLHCIYKRHKFGHEMFNINIFHSWSVINSRWYLLNLHISVIPYCQPVQTCVFTEVLIHKLFIIFSHPMKLKPSSASKSYDLIWLFHTLLGKMHMPNSHGFEETCGLQYICHNVYYKVWQYTHV